MIRSLDELVKEPASLNALASVALSDLLQKLPPEFVGTESDLAIDSPGALTEALASAKERLLAAITEEDAP